jgi:TetR/AcrR family transcriptional repressor of nem operon
MVKTEVQAFADINVAWLAKSQVEAGVASAAESEAKAR